MNKLDIQIGDLILAKNMINHKVVTRVYENGDLECSGYVERFGCVYVVQVSCEDIIEVKHPCQYNTIYPKETILTDEEREYLNAVIKPFRDEDISISKIKRYGKLRLVIRVNDDNICFPYFDRGYYDGLELEKEYTLEELGL